MCVWVCGRTLIVTPLSLASNDYLLRSSFLSFSPPPPPLPYFIRQLSFTAFTLSLPLHLSSMLLVHPLSPSLSLLSLSLVSLSLSESVLAFFPFVLIHSFGFEPIHFIVISWSSLRPFFFSFLSLYQLMKPSSSQAWFVDRKKVRKECGGALFSVEACVHKYMGTCVLV